LNGSLEYHAAGCILFFICYQAYGSPAKNPETWKILRNHFVRGSFQHTRATYECFSKAQIFGVRQMHGPVEAQVSKKRLIRMPEDFELTDFVQSKTMEEILQYHRFPLEDQLNIFGLSKGNQPYPTE
jgi:hypothetical protein